MSFACGGLTCAWLGLRMRKLVTNRWVHVYPGLVSMGEVEEVTRLLESQLARARTWRPRSSRKSRMDYLPWLMSCWLLRLNPGARGEHLTNQLSWVAARLLITRVCPVYLVKERCYRWEGGELGKVGESWAWKTGKVYEWSEVARWERWGNSEVTQSERYESS